MIFLYAIIIFFILCILYHYTALVIQAKKYPPPGELVSVNGHKLHILEKEKVLRLSSLILVMVYLPIPIGV